MNIATLLAMAALHQRNGQSDVACQLMTQASTLEGFDSYVAEVIRCPMNSALVGGVPRSENTLAPSLHGQDSLNLAVAIASNIYAHNSRLDEDEVLEFSPSTEALAYASGNDSDFIDDNELVSTSNNVESVSSFGRIEIKF